MAASAETTLLPGMKVTLQELKENGIPANLRDSCSHLLIPLNQCRRNNMFLPFKCTHERHGYEVCAYKEYQRHLEIQEKRQFEEKFEAYKSNKK